METNLAPRLSIAAALLAVLIFPSCSSDDLRCGFKDVEIRAANLPAGSVGLSYDGLIETEIDNEPNDDDYEFEFFLGFGDLPPGLELRRRGNQLLGISGTPTEAGTFRFEIVVEAWFGSRFGDDDFFGSDCDHLSGSREFTIVVNDE